MSSRKNPVRKKSELAEWRRTLLPPSSFDGKTSATHVVRFIRKTLDMTQQQLADHLHTYQATVARWEAGTHLPRGGYLAELEALFHRAWKLDNEAQRGWRTMHRKK